MVELSCCAQKAQWKTIQKRREFMDRFFHVTEKGSTIRTEIMAGITTFMAMAYILMVNAGMFSNPFGDGTDVLGVSYGAIYVATAHFRRGGHPAHRPAV